MKTEIRKITPNEAAKILKEQNVGNRKLSAKTVSFYADQMIRGQWELTGQGISFDKNGNLLDGQNRLAAIVKANIPIKFLIVSDIDRRAFKVYDTGKKRTSGDAFKIEGVKNYITISTSISRYLKYLKGAEIGVSSRNKERKITNADLLKIYKSDSDFWDLLFMLGDRCYSHQRIISKTDIISFSAYLIKHKNKDYNLVELFFQELVGIEPESHNVISLYRNMIINDSLSSKKLKHEIKMKLLMHTWNYYETGKTIKILRFSPNAVYKIN